MNTRRVIALVCALLLLASAPAAASSVHLKGGKNAEPTFYDGGLTLTASGAIAGLGGGDVFVNLTARADVSATCANPSGATQPPGQNPAEADVTGGEAIPEEELKNGSTPFSVTTEAPPSEVAGAPDCPNPQWTETIEDLAFTSATITVEQPEGTTVLTVICSIDPPTDDGAVPARDVTCQSG